MPTTVVNAGETVDGAVLDQSDVQQVYGTANGTVANDLGEQVVHDGGTANAAILNQGGGQAVYGTANDTVAHLGGVQLLYSGTATGTVLDQGIQAVYGGLSEGTVIESSGYQTISGGQVDGTHVASGGTQDVFGGAMVTNTLIDGNGTQRIEFGSGPISISGERIMPGAHIYFSNVPDGAATSVQFDRATDVLSLQAGDQTVSLHLVGDYSDTDFSDVVRLCFCRGTGIRTPGGDVAVEALRVGDEVVTGSGRRRPIRWIGSAIAIAGRGNRPVIVRAGAFPDGSPHRDVRVTRSHSFLFGDVLIPIEQLVNGTSILFDEAARAVEVFHVELDRHDILLADGAPAESFRDIGNRAGFVGGDRAGGAGALPTCAPLVYRGPIVERTRRRLAERARAIAGGKTAAA